MSTEVVEALPSPCFRRDTDRESVDVRGELADRCSEGRTSFFCFDLGRISSRSTGTPRETRKSRRVLERIQSGGDSGGGATSCDHSDAERGLMKTEASLESGGREGVSAEGWRADRRFSVVEMTSSGLRPSKSGIGYK